MAIIDPTKTWVPVEERLAVTTDERHRQVLGIVLEHMKAEAEPDMDRLMATLSPNPDYHFWYANADMGPKTTEGVRAYYEAFVASGANHLVFEIDRLAVDDDLVMTEGWMKMIYPGAAAQAIGVEVEDPDGDYLLVHAGVVPAWAEPGWADPGWARPCWAGPCWGGPAWAGPD